MNAMISAERLSELDGATKSWLMDLITRNMKALYEESDWGWKTANKEEEMFDDRAWYLIARDMEDGGKLLGFSHFRFDMDYDDEVDIKIPHTQHKIKNHVWLPLMKHICATLESSFLGRAYFSLQFCRHEETELPVTLSFAEIASRNI